MSISLKLAPKVLISVPDNNSSNSLSTQTKSIEKTPNRPCFSSCELNLENLDRDSSVAGLDKSSNDSITASTPALARCGRVFYFFDFLSISARIRVSFQTGALTGHTYVSSWGQGATTKHCHKAVCVTQATMQLTLGTSVT